MRLLRATFAAFAGAFVALALYLAWFFQITHHDTPWDGAPLGFVVLTGLVAAIFGFAAGWIASRLSEETRRGSAEGAAGFIALAALFAETHTPGQHHYAQMVALLVMAPVTYFYGRVIEKRSVVRE